MATATAQPGSPRCWQSRNRHGGELGDGGEGLVEAVAGIEQAERAHAGRVDDEAAAGQREQLAWWRGARDRCHRSARRLAGRGRAGN